MKKQHPKIAGLQAIRSNENGEPLVNLENIYCDYRRQDARVSSVLVRKSVANKLQKVQEQLSQYDAGMKLCVVEGYRSPIYQEQYFLKELLVQYKNDPLRDFQVLLDEVHRFVALPSVAGHPTGGAVDLTIALEGEEIDMGGHIADFRIPELLPTYSHLATLEQRKGRMLLHDLMIAEGFAAFYGEWWHFSYGDREWAAFYDLFESMYSPIHL